MASNGEKITKAAAEYKDSAATRNCRACQMFIASGNACTLVKGLISPRGTCRFWEPRNAANTAGRR